MISTYSNTNQIVPVDGLINFDTTRIFTGCTVQHADGTPTFTLTKPGYYYVTFNAIVTATTTGNITAELINGNDQVPGALSSVTIGAANDVGSLAFATIIRVLPSCAAIDNTTKLTINNAGIEATYTNVNINITKLC